MKTKSWGILCALAVALAGVTRASAESDPAAVVVDTVIVRPVCLGVTIFGSAFFVISLPVAAISGSIHSTANALITKPAAATFTRPLGDMDALVD
jgi:hypothetical protein